MDPLNKRERKLAIWQFVLIYGLSLVIPFAASAFLFRTPTGALERENEKLRVALGEQARLYTRLETMVKGLQRLGENDKAYVGTTNDLERGNLKRNINEHESTIQTALYDLKRDTTAFQVDSIRQFSGKIITVVDAALSYRNTISYLREMLEKNGANTQAIDRLNTDLAAKNDKIRMLELMVAQPQPAAADGRKKNAGPKAPDCQECQSQLQTAQEELIQLRTAGPATAGSNPVNEAVIRDRTTKEFVAVLIQKGDDARKAPCARKPMYELAIETLSQHPKPEARSTIEDLYKRIRRISD